MDDKDWIEREREAFERWLTSEEGAASAAKAAEYKTAAMGLYSLSQAAWLAAKRDAAKQAKPLLEAAQCPQCGDKSGAYYDGNGQVCQCQWCYEVDMLNAAPGVE